MSKIKISNMLYQAFPMIKNVSLIVVVGIFALATTVRSDMVFGQSLISNVDTKVTANFDHTTKNFIATQNTVEGALAQGGIFLNKNDITNPPRESLLDGKDTIINVTRQLPVLISDGNQEHLAFSAYSAPQDILKQLNITVYPEDKVAAELIMDPVDEKAAGQKIIINRAPTFTVEVDGENKIVRSWGSTIADVLKNNITLGQKDIVEPSLGSTNVNVDMIKITRVNVVDTEETVSIPYDTIYQNDYNLYQGQSKVVQDGSNGQKKQQVRITYHNGAEIDRTVLSSEVTSTVQNKIIAKGVKPYSHQDLWNIMLQAQAKFGIDPSAMFSVMMCESGGNVYSGAGSSHQGLFQWDGSFYNWSSKAGYSGASIFDPTAQIMATAARVSSSGGWGAWSCKP